MIRVHPARRRDFARWARRHRIRTVSSTEFGVPEALFPKIPAELLEGALVDGRRILAPPPAPKAKPKPAATKAKAAKVAKKAAKPAPKPRPAPTPAPTPEPEQQAPPQPAAPEPKIVPAAPRPEPAPEPGQAEPETVIVPTTAATVGMQPEVLAAAADLLDPDGGGESPGHSCDDPACLDCGGPQPAGHKCPHCDRKFNTSHGLGIHQRRMHRDGESS